MGATIDNIHLLIMDKQELENLIKSIRGKIRGVTFQTDAAYVLAKEGEEGLKKLEEKVKELGLPIDYRKAKAMEWYPVGLRIASLLLIKETFGWPDQEIREMGKAAPKHSFIVKLFFKLFLSPKKLAQEVPHYWREHYTEGELQVVEFNEEKKKMILHLDNYQLHPLFCFYLEGYFETTMALTRESRQAAVKETKCMHRDNTSYHEYLITWQ